MGEPMGSTPSSSEITLVCYARASLLPDSVDRQVETLQAYEAEGLIDTVLRRSWPDRIALGDTGPHQEAIEVFEQFDRWATQQGVSIRPPFDVRTTTSLITDETKEVLVMPGMCLAVYRNQQLIGVYPHSTAADTYTVTEALAALRTGELQSTLLREEAEEPSPDETTPSATTCPDCGGSLINGQGLFACGECGWIGTVTAAGHHAPLSHDPRPDSSATGDPPGHLRPTQ